MSALNTVSYYLSYTDNLPIVNLPSGLAHLACGISEIIFGPEALPASGEDFECLTLRKLDDWTHLTKAIAILSIIGTVFLWIQKIKISLELNYVRGALDWSASQGQTFPVGTVPEKLFADREWVEAAATMHNGRSSSDVFERVPAQYWNDGEWIFRLIDQGIFRPEHFERLGQELQNNSFLALKILAVTEKAYQAESVYAKLPESLRNNPTIIAAAFIRAQSNLPTTQEAVAQIIPYITDKEVYVSCDEKLGLAALAGGLITFQDLCVQQQSDVRFCLAAVKRNHKNWGYLSPEMRKKPALLKDLKDWFNKGMANKWDSVSQSAYLWVQSVKKDALWFFQFRAPDVQAAAKEDAASFEDYFQGCACS